MTASQAANLFRSRFSKPAMKKWLTLSFIKIFLFSLFFDIKKPAAVDCISQSRKPIGQRSGRRIDTRSRLSPVFFLVSKTDVLPYISDPSPRVYNTAHADASGSISSIQTFGRTARVWSSEFLLLAPLGQVERPMMERSSGPALRCRHEQYELEVKSCFFLPNTSPLVAPRSTA